MELKGFETVKANLAREIMAIKGRTVQGMIESAIIIRRDMDATPPLIPVDTGNLRASWFVTTARGNQADAPSFKGKRAGEAMADHSKTVSEAQGMAAATSEPTVVMGFSANYALWVHEREKANFGGDPERAKRTKKKKYLRRPGAGAKFFEESINRNKDKILQTIQQYARVR